LICSGLATLVKLLWLYCIKLDWNEDVDIGQIKMLDWDSSGLAESTVSKFLLQTEENYMNSLSTIVGSLAATREQVRPD